MAKDSIRHWQGIFEKLGLEVTISADGCCGMSGLFGHEVANVGLSEKIFNLYWKPRLEKNKGVILATGFSCRCQLENHDFRGVHPAVFLGGLLGQPSHP